METSSPPPASHEIANLLSRLMIEIAESGAYPHQALEYLAERLREEGYYPELNNFGKTRCLLPGPHFTHGEDCTYVGQPWSRRRVRRFRTPAEGLASLMAISYHSTLSGNVEDLETCNVQVVKRYLRDTLRTKPWLRGVGLCGDGCGCGIVVNVSSIDDMDETLPEEIHGVSIEVRVVGNVYPKLRGETTGFSGYRSTADRAAPEPQIDADDTEVDRLDGVFDKVQDKLIASSVLSFCRGVLADEKKISGRIDGITDPFKDWLVRGIVLSFCRGEIKSAEAADKISGILDAVNPFAPSEESKKKVEEVAAQWVSLRKKMDSNPKIERALKGHFEHWMSFWKKWQNDDRDIDDLRWIIAEVNAARANAEQIETNKTVFVQDISNPVGDIASDKLSSARGKAEAVDDSVKSAQKELEKKLEDNKWKIAAAAAVTAIGVGIGIRVARG